VVEGARLALAYAAPGRAEEALDALRVFRREGYPLRDHALFLDRHAGLADPDAATLRALADEGPIALLATFLDRPALLVQAAALGVAEGPLPPLLQGKDLVALGVRPGPEMGRLLVALRHAQLAGTVRTGDEARAWLRERVNER
jgi:hypothetical protein